MPAAQWNNLKWSGSFGRFDLKVGCKLSLAECNPESVPVLRLNRFLKNHNSTNLQKISIFSKSFAMIASQWPEFVSLTSDLGVKPLKEHLLAASQGETIAENSLQSR